MVIQLVVYFVFSLPLYHSSRTFQFINISHFVLKPQVALNELKLNSTNIMCSLIIDKYVNNFNQLSCN